MWSVGIAPLILNLGARWRGEWSASISGGFTPIPLEKEAVRTSENGKDFHRCLVSNKTGVRQQNDAVWWSNRTATFRTNLLPSSLILQSSKNLVIPEDVGSALLRNVDPITPWRSVVAQKKECCIPIGNVSWMLFPGWGLSSNSG